MNCHTFLLSHDANLLALRVALSSTKRNDNFVVRASIKHFILAFRGRLRITDSFPEHFNSPDNVLTLDKSSLASDQNMLFFLIFVSLESLYDIFLTC